MFPMRAGAYAPWKHEYTLRGDESFQEHARYIIETGITPPSQGSLRLQSRAKSIMRDRLIIYRESSTAWSPGTPCT